MLWGAWQGIGGLHGCCAAQRCQPCKGPVCCWVACRRFQVVFLNDSSVHLLDLQGGPEALQWEVAGALEGLALEVFHPELQTWQRATVCKFELPERGQPAWQG